VNPGMADSGSPSVSTKCIPTASSGVLRLSWAAQSGLDQQAARSSAGFSSEFYGEAVSEELFLQTLDASIARGERSLEVMCHPAYVDRIIMGSAYCYPRLDELDVLTSASLKAAVADRGYRLGTYRDV
ncbi:ChbG/HpnK family deacetylase, partial [Klebsiella pneumoniae]|uniref:ChbG/HpnK family deacetylase n=1 Tax=Klebsiella pneumoniae TaxID=573 RepID=UPI00215B4C79